MRLLTAHDVAVLLKVRPARVYELAREGGLPSIRLGRTLRFDEETLVEFLRRAREDSRIQSDPLPKS